MRVRLRRGILNRVCGCAFSVQHGAVIDESPRTIRRDRSLIAVADTAGLSRAVAVTPTLATRYYAASHTDGDMSMARAGDEGATGLAAPAMLSATVPLLSRSHKSRDARNERTVMRRAKLAPNRAASIARKPRRSSKEGPSSGVPATSLHYVAGVAPVGVPASMVLGA
jgi:hypothetical protein